jgi:hypothetical protein
LKKKVILRYAPLDKGDDPPYNYAWCPGALVPWCVILTQNGLLSIHQSKV